MAKVESAEAIQVEAQVENPTENPTEKKGLFSRSLAGISRNVVVLGMVSFFTDVSSEMIIPVRILFLVLVLRTPLPLAGLTKFNHVPGVARVYDSGNIVIYDLKSSAYYGS